MNILFVWKAPFKNGGGVGRVTTILGPEFVKMGHTVAYLSLCTGEEYSESGIKQYFCPDASSPVTEKNLERAAQLIGDLDIDYIINQSGIYLKILQGLNKIKPDGVKVLSVHHNCISCLLENHSTIIRENYKNHILFPLIDSKFTYYLLKKVNRFKYSYYFRYCLKNSDRLVLLSEKFIPELKTYLNSYSDNSVCAIPNPAPFSTVKLNDLSKKNHILYVGRLNFQQKRADRIIEIWKELHEKFSDWQFDIVGDGPVLNDLKRMAQKEELERIYFHGYCDPRPYLKKAKIFVLTSDFEGFGMVLVEALAFGVVPIAFKCFSAIDDIIYHGENGIIIKNFNISDYLNSLEELMTNENERIRMATNGYEIVEKFAPAKIAKKWMTLFKQLK